MISNRVPRTERLGFSGSRAEKSARLSLSEQPRQSKLSNQVGFSLTELLVTTALVGVLASFALPVYQDYLASARQGVLLDNVASIALLQADRLASRGAFAEGEWLPGGTQTLSNANRLGWSPGTDQVSYLVECDDDGGRTGECARDANADDDADADDDASGGYTVTATHQDDAANPLVVQFDAANNRL